MKIKNTTTIYSLNIPSQNKSSSFFEATSTKNLYFKNEEECCAYRDLNYPKLKIEKHDAVSDKDRQGMDRFVLLNIGKQFPPRDTNDSYSVNSYMKPKELEQVINANPDAVIAVNCKTSSTEHDSSYGIVHYTSKHTYFPAEEIDQDTKFIFHNRFVTRGQEVDITSAEHLIADKKLLELNIEMQSHMDAINAIKLKIEYFQNVKKQHTEKHSMEIDTPSKTLNF